MRDVNTGKTHSDQSKQKMKDGYWKTRNKEDLRAHLRNANLNKSKSPEHKQKLAAAQRGKIMINNGTKNRYVAPDELESLLNERWQRGRIKKS